MAKDVAYGEVAVKDEMPDSAGGRATPLSGLVMDIVRDENKHRTARCIAHYGEKTAASGAAAALRAKYGRKIEDRGLEFGVRRVTVKNGSGHPEDRHGLWVYYDPEKVVSGEWDKHAANEKEKSRKAAAKAKEKAAQAKLSA